MIKVNVQVDHKPWLKKINNPNLSYYVVDVSNFKNVEDTVGDISKTSSTDILINNLTNVVNHFRVTGRTVGSPTLSSLGLGSAGVHSQAFPDPKR